MECFAAVVAEDTGLVYNLRSTDVPRSVTQTTQRIYRGRQTDRRTKSVTTHRGIAGLLNDKGEEAEINPKLTQLENNQTEYFFLFFGFVFYFFCWSKKLILFFETKMQDDYWRIMLHDIAAKLKKKFFKKHFFFRSWFADWINLVVDLLC